MINADNIKNKKIRLSIIMAIDLLQLHLHWGTCRYKGREYRSYSLARPYRKEGKNQKEIIFKLGKLSDEEAAKWRNLLQALKKPNAFLTTFDEIVVNKHYAYLDVAAANAIWDAWGLDEVFKTNGKRDINIATIARILTINRCIDPASKSKTPEWFCSTALPWLLEVNTDKINSSRIFRELAPIERHKDEICKHLFTRIKQSNPNSVNTIFYDLSSSSFEGTKCPLVKWGHCKEGYENHVVLALVVNEKGLPFYWEVLPGGTADSKTLTRLVERLKERFKVSGITLVFDRGIVSNDNLTFLEDDNIKYISAMDKNQIETITGIDFTLFSYLNPEQVDEQADHLPEFKKIDKNIYYREIKVDDVRRYILCFNPQLFKDQRKAREKAIAYFRIFVGNMNAELANAKKSRQKEATYKKFKRRLEKAKLKGFVDVELHRKYVIRKTSEEGDGKICTYHATVKVNESEMLHAGRLDGFWLLVTNHVEEKDNEFRTKAEDAIRPYREKQIIESAFRDIKSFVEVAPVFVWTEEHVRAHYSVCVISYLINRTITMRLHNSRGNDTKGIVSHEKLYKKLSECQIDYIEVKNISQKRYSMTKYTDEQKELLERVGLIKLIDRDIVEKANAHIY